MGKGRVVFLGSDDSYTYESFDESLSFIIEEAKARLPWNDHMLKATDFLSQAIDEVLLSLRAQDKYKNCSTGNIDNENNIQQKTTRTRTKSGT